MSDTQSSPTLPDTYSIKVDTQQVQIAPFYLVFDVSYSMSDVMGELNSTLRTLKNLFIADPMLSDIGRISVITFSNDAKVVISLSDFGASTILDNENLLTPEGGTSFSAVFDLLSTLITDDIKKLKAQNPDRKVLRPFVFFLTDGEPTEDDATWKSSFGKVTSGTPYPNILPLGFGDADEETLKYCVWPKKRGETFYFIAKNGVNNAAAMKEIAKIVTGSVVATTTSVRDGLPQAVIRDEGTQGTLRKGFTVDEV